MVRKKVQGDEKLGGKGACYKVGRCRSLTVMLCTERGWMRLRKRSKKNGNAENRGKLRR